MATQDAIFHGAGECSSIMLVSSDGSARSDTAVARAVLERAARLMWVMENRELGDPEYAPGNLHVLVAVAAALLPGPQREFAEFPETLSAEKRRMRRGDGSADVLIQISAATETDRRYALRLAKGIFEGHAASTLLPAGKLKTCEVHGASVFSGLEPFGYRDGGASDSEGLPPRLMNALRTLRKNATPKAEWVGALQRDGLLPPQGLADPERTLRIFERALEDDAPTNGGRRRGRNPVLTANPSEQADRRRAALAPLRALAAGEIWLLYQRFEHKLDELTNLDPLAHVGRLPVGGDPARPAAPSGSHVAVAQDDLAAGIERRGFAYRNDSGVEGLVFVGLADDPSKFKSSLERHLAHDPLLDFTSAESSGVYRVPENSQQLLKAAQLEGLSFDHHPIPPAALVLLRPGHPTPRLVNYQLIPEVIEYVQLARAHGLFLEPTMDLHPSFEAGLAALEKNFGGPALGALRKRIREQSELLYNFNGSYFSLGI